MQRNELDSMVFGIDGADRDAWPMDGEIYARNTHDYIIGCLCSHMPCKVRNTLPQTNGTNRQTTLQNDARDAGKYDMLEKHDTQRQ